VRAFAAGLVGGSLGVLRLSAAPETVFAAIGPLTVLLAAALGSCVARRRCPPWAVLSIGLLIGALVTLLACERAASRVIDERRVGVDILVDGRVVGVPRRDGRRLAFELAVEAASSIEDGTPIVLAPRRLALSRYRGGDMRAGERWRLTVRLRPLAGLRNAGGFDRVRHLLTRGIDASGSVRDRPPPVRLAAGRGLDAWRERLAAQLESPGERAGRVSVSTDDGGSAHGTDRAVALARALVLGIGHGVDDEVRALLRDTGTAHLLAISGLHVTLVAGWGLWVGRTFARRAGANVGRAAALGLGAGLALASGYALMAGFGLPVRRALAMLAVCFVAAFRLRALSAGSALAAALVAALAIDPLAPLSVGFWLSFGTVGALVWLHAGRMRRGGDGIGARGRALLATLRTHLLLGVVLLPVTAWFFQSGAWTAPLANAVAVPVVGLVVVPLAFAAVVFGGLVPALASLALYALGAVTEALFATLEWLLSHTGGAGTLALPSLESLLWCLLGLALLFGPRGLAPRRLALFLLLPALLANAGRGPRVEGFELHVLDVGQGLAALVLTPRSTWLYDTGGNLAPGYSMLEAVVVPYLHALGRRRVDVIVVSHPDSDHAAGLGDARERWPEARVIVGVPGGKMPVDATPCRAGDSETHDGVRLSFLHPAAHDTLDENDASCVLLVQQGSSRALLTGDIERAGERLLVERVGILSVSVMTAPHHGSRTSSGPALLDAFAPAHVVFPAGYRNAYRFPHREVEMRYKTAGAVSHVTARDGALRFAFGPAGLVASPSSWHTTRHRFWHDMLEPSCRRVGTVTADRVSGAAGAPLPGQSSCGTS